MEIKTFIIVINHLQIKKISTSNNSWEVDMPLNKPNKSSHAENPATMRELKISSEDISQYLEESTGESF